METTVAISLKRSVGEMLDANNNATVTKNSTQQQQQTEETEGPPSKKFNRGSENDENVEKVLSELVNGENIFYTGRRKDIHSDFSGREVEDRGILREYPLTRTTEFHCDICGKDVTHEVRVKCYVSQADICLECFKDGKETEKHKSNMPYSVIDNLTEDMHEGWECAEELALLEGLRLYGIGNWDDIATHIGTRNDNACKEHYWKCYLKGHEDEEITSPKVDRTSSTTTTTTTTDNDTTTNDNNDSISKHDNNNSNDFNASNGNYAEAGGKKPVDRKSNATTDNGSRSNGNNAVQLRKDKLPGSDISGYLPLRGDFEVEHDNDAELAIADMDFPLNDNPLERSLKLKIIEMYNCKLDERERRKRMVERYGLLEVHKNKQIEKRRPKAERDIHDRMRVFARFLKKKEYDTFVNNLIREMQLRQNIEKLREYRENGIRTLQEGRIYDLEKIKRDQEAKVRKHRASTPYLFKNSSKTGGTQRNARYAKRGEDSAKGATNSPSGASSKNTIHSELQYELLNVSNLPQVEKLSDKEKKLCSTLRLDPTRYLSIKNAIVKECLKQGTLGKNKANRIIKMDLNKSGELYDFFVSTSVIQK